MLDVIAALYGLDSFTEGVERMTEKRIDKTCPRRDLRQVPEIRVVFLASLGLLT
jgi:hypothetical protein